MPPPQLLRHYKQACAAMEPVDPGEGDPRALAALIDGIGETVVHAAAVEVHGRSPDPDSGVVERPVLTANRSGSWIGLAARCSCGRLEAGEICVHGQALANRAWSHLTAGDGAVPRLHDLLDLVPLLPDPAEAARDPAGVLFSRLAEPEAAYAAKPRRLVWRLHAYGLPAQAFVQELGRRGWKKGGRLDPDETGRLELDTRDLALLQITAHGGSPNTLADWRLLAGHPLLQDAEGEPVTVEEAPLEVAVRGRHGAWQLVFPQLEDDSTWMRLGADCVAVFTAAARRLRLHPATPEQLHLRSTAHRLRIGDAVAFGEDFRTVMARAQATLPRELAGEPVAADPAVQVVLDWREELQELSVRLAVRPLPTAAWQAPGGGPPRISARDERGRWLCAERRLAEEAQRGHQLREALALPAPAPWSWRLDIEAAADLCERAAALNLKPQWRSDPLRTALADSDALRVQVQRRRDWFGVAGQVEVGELRAELAELLLAVRAVRADRRWIRLGSGRLLRLSEDLRRRLGQLAAAGSEAPASAAPLLDDALAGLAEAQVDGDRAWLELQGRLRAAQALQPEVPSGLRAELRDYQRQGFAWLARLSAWGAGAVLADDMGLGKTVQAIALLVHRAELGAALVVCPTSVEGNWRDELARFAPGLRVHAYRERRSLDGLAPGDVLLASYGLLQRQAAEFASLEVATLVADEAQQVKNADAKRSRALAAVAAGMRVALTGTPVENRLDELWSIMSLAVPGLLGTREDFASRCAAPIEAGAAAAAPAREALRRRIAPFVLRRTKEAVIPELPPRTDIAHAVILRGPERELYDSERTRIVAELEARRAAEPQGDQRFAILAALTRLRQLACAPGLILPDYGAASAKLDALVELLTEMKAGGHRCLVFSQFTGLLDLAGTRLAEAGLTALRLDGSTPAERRRELVGLFQEGTGDAFLISLRAGGTGLNLTAADYVIHLDPWWNPAVEDQASDRAHRLGQTRPVTVYRLVASGTIEERILELHREKRDLMDALLDGADLAGRMGADELLTLMRGI